MYHMPGQLTWLRVSLLRVTVMMVGMHSHFAVGACARSQRRLMYMCVLRVVFWLTRARLRSWIGGQLLEASMSSFDDADAWDPFAEQEPIDTQVVDFLEEAELRDPLLVLEGTAAADVSLSPVRQALPVAVAVDQATSPSVTLEKPELPTCSPPPRKRLRGKQPPPELPRPAPRVPCDPEALSFTDENSATGQRWADLIKGFDDMEWRMKWRMVHRRFVWWLGVQRQRLADKPEPTATEQHVARLARETGKRLVAT